MVNNGVCKNPNLALLSSFCIYVGAIYMSPHIHANV